MVRPKVHDEALRRRLLERAGAMLSAGGPAALSLRTLAHDCGTSTTAVYSLFGGKPALLNAVLEEALLRFTAHLAVVPGDDPVADLVRLGAAYRLGALADPHLFDAMFTGELQPVGAQAALGRLRELVERAVEDKALRPDLDPATAAVTLWATVHGWVSLQRRGLLPDDPAPRLEEALHTVLDGWRAPVTI
ncbi:TetR/AcrR family transcriptional regulator [Pseudonocardia aurantiaca]|uniref:TetR/AcrR family transcriptional regulator n=1 Tax=Pseudonocardia aurantiaca TaxID=75290 RepID=A0ABW4FD69_9PSEU